MTDARTTVKRARLDPKVIVAWNDVCARDAALRRRLRNASSAGVFVAFGLALLSGALHPDGPAMLAAGIGVALAITVCAMIWNNILVGKPPCPSCGEPIKLRGNSRGWSARHPESEEWCPHCFVWLKHPADPHRPLA